MNLNDLGACLAAQNDVAGAEAAYRRALAIQELVLEPTHPELATTLNNLAVLHKGEGNYVEAAALYARALRILEMTLPPSHPALQRCRHNEARLRQGIRAMFHLACGFVGGHSPAFGITACSGRAC